MFNPSRYASRPTSFSSSSSLFCHLALPPHDTGCDLHLNSAIHGEKSDKTDLHLRFSAALQPLTPPRGDGVTVLNAALTALPATSTEDKARVRQVLRVIASSTPMQG